MRYSDKNTKYKNKRKIRIRKLFLLILSVGLIITCLIIVYSREKSSEPRASDKMNNFGSKGSSINVDKEQPPQIQQDIPADDTSQVNSSISSGVINVKITRANRSMVRVYVEKIDSGTCKMTIKQNGQVKYYKEAKTISLNDYSTCEGFNIDSEKIDNSSFVVNIEVISGDRKGYVSQEVL